MPKHRGLPSDPAIERAVLGMLLTGDEGLVAKAKVQLRPDHFFHPAHQIIWRAISAAIRRGLTPDALIVRDILEQWNRLDQVGGLSYLNKLIAEFPTTAAFDDYCEILETYRVRRAVTQAAHRMLELAGKDIGRAELATKTREIIDRFTDDVTVGDTITGEAFRDLIVQAAQSVHPLGYSTGIPEIDDLQGGLEPGSVNVIAALPGTGKTLLALAMLRRQVLEQGYRVGFISLEMSPRAIGTRHFCALMGIDRGELYTRGWRTEAFEETAKEIARDGHYYAFRCRHVEDIHIKAMEWKDRFGIQILYVDHLQEVRTRRRVGSQEEEIASIMSELKAMAMELDLAVVVMAQFNRRVGDAARIVRSGNSFVRATVLSWLKGSSKIEQVASIIAYLWRDKEEVEELGELVDVWYIVCKNREGREGKVKLTLNYRTQDIVPASPVTVAGAVEEEIPF